MAKSNGDLTGKDRKTGRFMPGNAYGHGRVQGSRNHKTLAYEAMREIAEKNGVSVEEIQKSIIKIAIRRALEGDFRFYKDLMDRNYGKAKESVAVMTGPEDNYVRSETPVTSQ